MVNLRIVGHLIIASLLIGLGAWTGHKASESYCTTHVEAEKARANKAEQDYDDLAEHVRKQNDALKQMQSDAEERSKRAAQDVAQAKARSLAIQARASLVMASAAPEHGDVCTSASAAFDDELRDERGTK